MDNITLIIALSMVSITCSVALFANWAGNRHVPGLFPVALGYTTTSLGIFLLSTQTFAPPLLSVVLANALVLGGRLPLLLGMTSFWNQEKSRLPTICSVLYLLTIAGIFYFAMIEDSALWRIRIYTVMAVTFSACIAYTIINGLKIERSLRPVMAVSSNYGAYFLAGLFSFNAVTEFILMLIRPGVPLTDPSAGTAILLLGSIFTMLVIALGVVIMTQEELTVENKENSIFDPITTILNHRTFIEVCQRILGVALRYTKPVSMLTIEISNLDEVAGKFGVRIANEFLRHFSMLATDRRRHEDVLARCSFNEFRMLLPGVDEKGAEIVVKKIRSVVETEDFVYRGKKLKIDMVVSCITKREEDLHLQQMMQEGELEMFRVKQRLASKTN